MVTEQRTVAEQRMVEKWEEKVKANGHQFAQIRTIKAIYDRVAVVANLSTMITIQYPVGKSKGKNLKTIFTPSFEFTIKQEGIAKREIVDIKWYKN